MEKLKLIICIYIYLKNYSPPLPLHNQETLCKCKRGEDENYYSNRKLLVYYLFLNVECINGKNDRKG